MTQSSASLPEDTVQTNVFTQFPPIIPMVIIGTVLIAMAQFGSTERLAAALAWLIFVAVLFADGPDAFGKLTGRISPTQTTTQTERKAGQ
jgi:hypothetical protein